jgi:hypothetical protein
VSSTIALEALREGNSHVRSSILGLSLQLMLHFVFAFFEGKEQVVSFFRQYAERWQGLSVPPDLAEGFERMFARQADRILTHFSEVARIHQRLEATETGVLGKWVRHAYWLRRNIIELFAAGQLGLNPPAATHDEAIRRLLTSYIHMMNNRLGVLILEEVYLADLIIRALDRNP